MVAATGKASAQNVDFTNVKEAGQFNPKQVPVGDYLARIVKVEDGEAKDKTFMWVFTIKLERFGGYSYPYYCKLQENQLWKLRNLAVAAGLAVPKRRVKLDPNKLVNKTIGVTMEDDEYEGKMKSVIAAVFPAAELADGAVIDDDDDDEYTDDEDLEQEDTEEEVDEAEEEVDEEEDEGEEVDPYADYTRDQLKRLIKKLDPSYSVRRNQTDDDLRAEIHRLEDEEGGAAEEEEPEPEPEPEPTPAPRARAARTSRTAAAPASRAKAGTTKRRAAAQVTDEELEELDIDDL